MGRSPALVPLNLGEKGHRHRQGARLVMQGIRGKRGSMIFQERDQPQPIFRIGDQGTRHLTSQEPYKRRCEQRTLEALEMVGHRDRTGVFAVSHEHSAHAPAHMIPWRWRAAAPDHRGRADHGAGRTQQAQILDCFAA
jgi:hypothetical protein